mgnify:CR=1 FL=1
MVFLNQIRSMKLLPYNHIYNGYTARQISWKKMLTSILVLITLICCIFLSGCSHTVTVFIEKEWSTEEYYKMQSISDMKTRLEYKAISK